jgi:hypothetical protein
VTANRHRLRLAALLCGLGGPVLLSAYFAAPVFTGWPLAGAAPELLEGYAAGHARLFYAGAWLQASGALLSVVFFLLLAELAQPPAFARGLVLTGASVMLSVVVIDAAFMVAVPMAAANGDLATVATAFALSNGVFVRVFPLVPAPLMFAGAAVALSGSALLPRVFVPCAWLLAAFFELAGIGAIFSQGAFIAAVVLSIVQQAWIVSAAICLWLRRRS